MRITWKRSLTTPVNAAPPRETRLLRQALPPIGALVATGGTVLVLATLTGFTVHQQRAWLLTEATRLTSALATETLGVPLEIARIEGLTWNGVSLQGVRLMGSHAPGAPVVARIPELQVEIDPLDWLRLGPRAVHLVAIQPEVRLARDAKGQLNLKPRPASAGGTGAPLPPFRLTVQNGAFHWHDPLITSSVTQISGDLTLRDGVASLEASGLEAKSPIRLSGTHRLADGQGSGTVHAENLDLPRWSRMLTPKAPWAVHEGRGNADLQVAWGSATHFSGSFQAA